MHFIRGVNLVQSAESVRLINEFSFLALPSQPFMFLSLSSPHHLKSLSWQPATNSLLQDCLFPQNHHWLPNPICWQAAPPRQITSTLFNNHQDAIAYCTVEASENIKELPCGWLANQSSSIYLLYTLHRLSHYSLAALLFCCKCTFLPPPSSRTHI